MLGNVAAILRQMVDEELHLVGEDVAVGQDQMLDPARPIRHGEQWHAGLLRRVRALVHIARNAGADDVFPYVEPAPGHPVYRTWFFNEFRLFEVGLVDSERFQPWRQ